MAKLAAFAGLAAVTAFAAGCGRKPAPPSPKPVVAATPPSGQATSPPLSYRQTTPDAEVALSLPPAVAKVPPLYTKLYADGRNTLEAFADGAKGDLADVRANGEPVHPYRQTLDYAVSAETPRLISLQLTTREDSGGSRPTASLKGLIWDKATGHEVKPADLFAAGADLSAADKALCDAIHAAKKARAGDPALTGDLKACPKLSATALTLAPSTAPGKAGGVTALFSPYALDGKAGAAYRIAVPLQTLRPVLAPAYAGEFAGAPAPDAGDPA